MGKGNELLTLRDGTKLERAKIYATMKQLVRLSQTDLETFYRFLGLAAKPEWQVVPGQSLHDKLNETTLLEDGRIPEGTRHILKSSLSGEYPDFKLIWPVAD